MGEFFLQRKETNKAVECLKNGLEQARSLYHGKPCVLYVKALNDYGVALKRAERFEESLLYLKEAKEMMDEHQAPQNYYHVTLGILNNIATVHYERGDIREALQSFKDVLDMDPVMSGENEGMAVKMVKTTICMNVVEFLMRLQTVTCVINNEEDANNFAAFQALLRHYINQLPTEILTFFERHNS